MANADRSSNGETPGRGRRIQQVLDESLRRRAAGEKLSDEDVIARHADLMPELRERLHALKLIENAGRQANGAPNASSASSGAPGRNIEGRCPRCQTRWRVKAELAGRRFRCKKCGMVIVADALENGSESLGGAPGPVGGAPSSSGSPTSIPGYKIESELGHGGMGRVYRARELATKRTVALKVMLEKRSTDEHHRRRFEREVEIAASLQHQNIARLYASGLHQGHYWFAMEYVEGETLDAYIAREQLGIRDLLALFVRICAAVNHAHMRGVIHRDLKPGNIMVDGEGQPRVLDFGLAKQLDRPAESMDSLSASGQIVGTPAYMSPEQIRGNRSGIDIRSDVYSLGVILYRLLTGQAPYGNGDSSLVELLRAITEDEPTPPRHLDKDIPDEVSAIVMKSLEKDRERRYQGAGEMGRDIVAYLAGEAVIAMEGSAWYTLRKTAARYKGPAITVAAVIVLSLTLGLTMSALYTKTKVELREVQQEVIRWREAPTDESLRAELANAEDAAEAHRLRAERAQQSEQEVRATLQTLEAELAGSETVLDGKVHIESQIAQDVPQVARLCESMDIEKRRISVGDCELYCEQEGDGMALVLLHGGPGATHHGFHPSFSQAGSFAKVFYYDQRGCGQSDYEKGEGYSVDQAVDDLENLRKALEVKKWIVLGHSYGGLLAQSYAVKYPDHLAGLVLVGSSVATPISLDRTRQYDFLSQEERTRIREIHRTPGLSMELSVYNAFLNGDWKRQRYYKPSREQIARIALYEWKHAADFRGMLCPDTQRVDLSGAFKRCPIPTLIVEGKWDLTWNTDKPRKLRENHPRAKLVMFKHSAHSPFDDEPKKFFARMQEFVRDLPKASRSDLNIWKKHYAQWKKKRDGSLAHLVRSAGWGRKSNDKIARAYSRKGLKQLHDPVLLLKTGFALYDAERYDEALAVFKRMREKVQEDDKFFVAVSLVWQGHMLDLLGRRAEAISAYQRVVDMKQEGKMQHSQYGMTYSPSEYAATRIETPFTRIQNRDDN